MFKFIKLVKNHLVTKIARYVFPFYALKNIYVRSFYFLQVFISVYIFLLVISI